MARKSISGGQKLAQAIRDRRLDLELTIEEAAKRAGVGTKTWSRYEAGEPIRADKCLGVCRAMEWRSLPGALENPEKKHFQEDLKQHEAWSSLLAEAFGDHAAAAIAVGSDILWDDLEEELASMSALPRGSHIGQLSFSLMKDILPPQFLMRYDYDFLYRMKATLHSLRTRAGANTFHCANTVMEELLVQLCVDEARYLEEMDLMDVGDVMEDWDEWMYKLFQDQDMHMFLFGKWYVEEDNPYHFDRWSERQFFCTGGEK